MNLSKQDLSNPKICRALGKQSLFYFAAIYFTEMFKFPTPDFHNKWYKLLEFGKDDDLFGFLVLMGFRDSAKTTLSKIKIVRDICYRRKKLISYVCFEKEASAEALFDIASWLQTNKLIIRDFGHLFLDDDKNREKKPEKKSISNFVTSNGVRVFASSIRKSVRGKIFAFDRPDAYVIDDFENNVTKKSRALTNTTINYFKELIGGLAAGAEVIFICNYISDSGSVQWLLNTAENNQQWRVSRVDAEMGGKSVWPGRFVITDEEAKIENKEIADPTKHVRSLESIKRTLNADGSKTYEQEYLNQPIVEGDRFFNTELIDRRIRILNNKKWQDTEAGKNNYYKRDGNWRIWGAPRKNGNYVIAADVAEGFGNDSAAIEVLDVDNANFVMEYEDNHTPPDLLAKLMAEQGKRFNHALLAPERNSIGIAVINELKHLKYKNVYRDKTLDKISDTPVRKFGWHTNAKTKPTMLFEFKRDFEAGQIGIYSIPLLKEMRAFTNQEVTNTNFDPEVSNHFDRLMAACIAWQMRGYRRIKGFIT